MFPFLPPSLSDVWTASGVRLPARWGSPHQKLPWHCGGNTLLQAFPTFSFYSLLWCIRVKEQWMNKPRSPLEKWNVPVWIRQSWTRQRKYQCISFVVYIECIWGTVVPVQPLTRSGCEHGLCCNTDLPCSEVEIEKNSGSFKVELSYYNMTVLTFLTV